MLKAFDFMRKNVPVLYSTQLTDEDIERDPVGYMFFWALFIVFEVPIIVIVPYVTYCDLMGIPPGNLFGIPLGS